MMGSANWHCELIADFSGERAGLGVANVMGIRRCPPAHDTRLSGDEFAVLLVAQTYDFCRGLLTAAWTDGRSR